MSIFDKKKKRSKLWDIITPAAELFNGSVGNAKTMQEQLGVQFSQSFKFAQSAFAQSALLTGTLTLNANHQLIIRGFRDDPDPGWMWRSGEKVVANDAHLELRQGKQWICGRVQIDEEKRTYYLITDEDGHRIQLESGMLVRIDI